MTTLLRLGRPAFAGVSAGFLLLLLFTLRRLPPVVASHFDGRGMPNAWSTRPVYLALMLLFGLVLPAGTVLLVSLLTRRGPQLLNLPHREYWRRPEHGPEAVRRSRDYMWWLAVILTATAAAMHLAILAAHRTVPPRLGTAGFLLVMVVLLAAIGLWTVGWYRLFRPGSAGA